MKLLPRDYNSVAQISSYSSYVVLIFQCILKSLHNSLLSGLDGVFLVFFAVGYISCEEQQ